MASPTNNPTTSDPTREERLYRPSKEGPSLMPEALRDYYRTGNRTWEESEGSLPAGDEDRLDFPMFDGLLAYFPNALAEVARVSKIGNDQHNPGQPMHWARGKSTDHLNKALRHIVDAGKLDARKVRHTARAAWRILAELQEEIEREGEVPLSRASRTS